MAEVVNGTPSPGLTDTPEAQETTIGMEKDMRKDPHSQGSSVAALEPYIQTVKQSLGHQGVNQAWVTYGPQAACGPQHVVVRPSESF